MPRTPYDPGKSGPQVHDRRAKDINRGTRDYIREVEVDDPYEPGSRIATVRSVRDDPLGDHFARHHIDEAQYLAGREFQRQWELAERGPRAIQLTEAVDGGLPPETLTNEALKAAKWLAKCRSALGPSGSIVVHAILVECKTARQVARERHLIGDDWSRYFGRRLWECLDTLAEVFGFSNGRAK